MYIHHFPGNFDVQAEEFGLVGGWIRSKSVVVSHTSVTHVVPRASNPNAASLVGQYLPECRLGWLERRKIPRSTLSLSAHSVMTA